VELDFRAEKQQKGQTLQDTPTRRAIAPPVYRFPDFLCIGAHKSGTSWLDQNLRNHPSIYLPPIKELQYFNELYIEQARRWSTKARTQKSTGALKRHVRNKMPKDWDYAYIAQLSAIASGTLCDDWYGRIFAYAAPDQVCGEISSDYFLLPEEGIAHAIGLSPALKVLFLMRDPIDRSWSHMRMTMRNRGIDDLEILKGYAEDSDTVLRADYPAAVAKWGAQVGHERLLPVFTDDIAAAPLAVLEKICAFLGVGFDRALFPKAAEPVHVGQDLEIPPTVYDILKVQLRPVYERIARLYPETGAGWMARHYRR